MGERVVFDPVAAAQSEARKPKPVMPLSYGHADRFAALRISAAAFHDAVNIVVRRLGGWRRVGFAFGLCFISAGFAYGLSETWHCDEAGFIAAVGGLLVGFTVPVKNLDVPPRAGGRERIG